EGAEEAQEGAAGATLLALRRRIDDRRLHPCSVLLEDTAHRGVRLAADRGRFALRDELPTCLLGNDGGEIGAVEGLLDALRVLSVLLTLAGAATEVLDPGPSRRDAGGVRALGIDAFRQGGGRKGGEQQRCEDTAVHALHGSLLAKVHRLAGRGTLGSKGQGESEHTPVCSGGTMMGRPHKTVASPIAEFRIGTIPPGNPGQAARRPPATRRTAPPAEAAAVRRPRLRRGGRAPAPRPRGAPAGVAGAARRYQRSGAPGVRHGPRVARAERGEPRC